MKQYISILIDAGLIIIYGEANRRIYRITDNGIRLVNCLLVLPPWYVWSEIYNIQSNIIGATGLLDIYELDVICCYFTLSLFFFLFHCYQCQCCSDLFKPSDL